MNRPLLDRAIDAIYDAAAGDTAWSDAVSSVVCAHGAERAILFTPTTSVDAGGLWAMHDVPPEIQQRYVGEYGQHDLWMQRGIAAGHMRSGHTVLGQELVTDAELQRTAIYADVLRHAGLVRLCSTILFDGSDVKAPLALFALFRDGRGAPFTRADQARFGATCRHVARAVRLWYGQRRAASPVDFLADSLTAPVIAVRADRRISWMNAAAATWAKDGRIRTADGRLLSIGGSEAAITLALHSAANGRGCEIPLASEHVTIEALPLASAAGNVARKDVLILLRDAGHCESAARTLAQRYRLTPAETALALALAAGQSLGEVSAARGVLLSTSRTQLKSLLGKTGCRRQAELVMLVQGARPMLRMSQAGPAPV
ncbi:MAG TPA: hypothetical protein VFE23_17400 [Usitatibacter sp.]|nr:hypothetical protein [Usitatibacter sp.]